MGVLCGVLGKVETSKSGVEWSGVRNHMSSEWTERVDTSARQWSDI